MERFKAAKRASMLGIVGNLFLMVIKCIIGFISHSQAMISDAFNSASDIFSSLLTYIGSKIASKKADDDHNLGHGKAEYIFSLIISLVMIVVSFAIAINSIKSLFVKTNYNYSMYLVIVCVVTILTKLLLYIYTHHLYKKFNNILLYANSLDHFNDMILTTLSLIAALLSKHGFIYFDGVVGAIISTWIIYQGCLLFKKSYDILMDKTMDDDIKNKIYDIVKEFSEIEDINHFNSTPVGYQYQVSLTIFVDGKLSTFESHEIANKLEKKICKLDEIYLAVIHVNPILKK